MKRLATAAVLLPLVIIFILKSSPFQFALLVALLALLGLDEFYRMTLPGRRGEGWLAAICGAASVFTVFATNPILPLFALTGLVLLFTLIALFRLQDIKQAAPDIALVLMGFLYVPLLLSHLVLVRMQPHGVAWLFLIMVIVMAGDSAAYYVGSTIGKHRIYPAVSPKKSVEGSIGGLAGSIIGALIARATFFPELAIADCVATALIFGVLGQLGDLFESLIKRSCGVKDSGVIFPGHGGVLDRLDSILFAAPAAFYYSWFFFKGCCGG
ncbi:phosphatidate cytidylyltransferase [Geomesophilobacter sediminis]|uniref:Phosphatidate cytidylyltransferase n=1 Tax=Geomesophilobacter sediminis TaxID=2798584 RepID=A0A8J7LXN7_9BACT|nr:phosphatidate cytidylyltransferase [Geomesophilobacter sediminis]MBJ6723472.1 phosphatidate cytidylyltransferase [Geomesophilobacter sediminis]